MAARCLKSLTLLLVQLSGMVLSGAVRGVTRTEVEALLGVKQNWHDPEGNLATWMETRKSSSCSWRGITCETLADNSSHVVRISLSGLLQGGSLNASIGGLPHLRALNLSGNGFAGNIPPDIAQLKKLASLDLSHNKFTGKIVVSIGNLNSLEIIRLNNNNLNGTIPWELSNLTLLTEMDIGFNQLEGPIPYQLGNLWCLQRLVLSYNSLSGNIPEELSFLQAIQYLMLERNKLSGEIPEEIGRLSNLSCLRIQNNSLSGPIPSSFGNLTGLLALHAGHNKLSGAIPNQLGNVMHLKYLEIQENCLVGEIPSSLGRLQSLVSLDLSGNNLTGTIPVSFTNLSSLDSLHLQNNNLTGVIPSFLWRFPANSFSANPCLCNHALTQPSCSCSFSSFPYSQRLLGSFWSWPNQERRQKLSSTRKTRMKVADSTGAVSLCILLFVILMLFRMGKKGARNVNRFNPNAEATEKEGRMNMFGRSFRYSYDEIVSCAGYYDASHVLGKGRFATVYLSTFPDGTQLAVKVFHNPNVSPKFEGEIQMLGTIKHPNLLTIRGLYSNSAEKAIFFDFMPNGSLYQLLHGDNRNPASLPWATRQRIAMRTAQALCYLHRSYKTQIIHGAVKSSNVLLDADMNPRLSDFGLSCVVPNPRDQGGPSIIQPSFYTAPELKSHKSTEKSDVYSFGILLMELITGCKPVSDVGDKPIFLLNWATRLHEEGRWKELLDQTALQTCPFPEILHKILNLAILCSNEKPTVRPTMSEVAGILDSLSYNPSPPQTPNLRSKRPLLSS